MDINLVKNVINGVNLVKKVIFGEIGQNWVILRPKRRHRLKFRENGQEIFSLTVSKIISVRFMDINVIKNVINGVNLNK